MSLWYPFGGGNIIGGDDGGNLIDCDDCPCGGDAIETTCCPDDPTPANLILTINSAACVNVALGDYPGSWDAGASAWVFPVACTGGTPPSFVFHLTCPGSVWNVQNSTGDCDCTGISASATETSCAPFEVTISDANWNFTFTEA